MCAVALRDADVAMLHYPPGSLRAARDLLPIWSRRGFAEKVTPGEGKYS
jgi:hypothetical protein